MTTNNAPELILKWGTVKGWSGFREGTPWRDALQKWADVSGVSASLMMQGNTQAHRDALCECIDAVFEAGGKVFNDWDNEYMSQDKAKAYVQGYCK